MADDVRSDEEGEELHFTSSDVDESPPPQKRKDIDDYDDSSICEEDDSSVYPSSDSDIEENRQVLIKTPQKQKIRITDTRPAGDMDADHCSDIVDNNEYQSEQDTQSESSHADDMCSNYTYTSDGNMSDSSVNVENSILRYSDSDLPSDDSSSDHCQDLSEEMPLYSGSTLTSSNLDALLLAFFKKHSMSEAAKEELLKLLELALPTGSNVATSSYMFNKRHDECTLPFELKELCPTCHNKVENEHCTNSECDQEGLKVDPLRFYVIPIKPQIQRLIKGKRYKSRALHEQLKFPISSTHLYKNGKKRPIFYQETSSHRNLSKETYNDKFRELI